MVVQNSAASVLIADADPYLCRIFEAKLLKDTPFDVVVANTGHDALQAALVKGFNTVLWDTRLRDTLRYLPRLRALCPEASIFLMTTDDHHSLNSDLRHLDISEILVKPFGLDVLIERVRASLFNPSLPGTTANLDFARIGQRIAIISEEGRCVTRALERRDETFVVVGAPRVSQPADFSERLPVRVEIIGEDALYSFQTRLLKALDLPIPSWEINLPTRILREQRRKYSRIHLALPIQLEQIAQPSSSELSQTLPGQILVGMTEDVSLNGCSVVSRKPLEVGMKVRFTIEGLPLSQIEGEGEVTRIQPLNEPDNPMRHQSGIQFRDLPSLFKKRLRSLVESD